jgi:hypothetical protein
MKVFRLFMVIRQRERKRIPNVSGLQIMQSTLQVPADLIAETTWSSAELRQ